MNITTMLITLLLALGADTTFTGGQRLSSDKNIQTLVQHVLDEDPNQLHNIYNLLKSSKNRALLRVMNITRCDNPLLQYLHVGENDFYVYMIEGMGSMIGLSLVFYIYYRLRKGHSWKVLLILNNLYMICWTITSWTLFMTKSSLKQDVITNTKRLWAVTTILLLLLEVEKKELKVKTNTYLRIAYTIICCTVKMVGYILCWFLDLLSIAVPSYAFSVLVNDHYPIPLYSQAEYWLQHHFIWPTHKEMIYIYALTVGIVFLYSITTKQKSRSCDRSRVCRARRRVLPYQSWSICCQVSHPSWLITRRLRTYFKYKAFKMVKKVDQEILEEAAMPLRYKDTGLQMEGDFPPDNFQDCAFYKPSKAPKSIAVITTDRSGEARGGRAIVSLVSVGHGIGKKEYLMTALHVPKLMGVNNTLYLINHGTTRNVTPFKFAEFKTKIYSVNNDIIFYEVPKSFKCRTGLKSAPLASSAAESGYIKVYTPFPNGKLGYHTGEYMKHPNGRIGQYMHRVSTVPGTSGSPVFSSGKIIGCHSGYEEFVDINVFNGVAIAYVYLTASLFDPRQYFTKEVLSSVPRTLVSSIPIVGPYFHTAETARNELIASESRRSREMIGVKLTAQERTIELRKSPEQLCTFETRNRYHRKGKKHFRGTGDFVPYTGSSKYYHSDGYIIDVGISDDGYEEHNSWAEEYVDPYEEDDYDCYGEVAITVSSGTAPVRQENKHKRTLNNTLQAEAIIRRPGFPTIEEYYIEAHQRGFLVGKTLCESALGQHILRTQLPPASPITADLDEAIALDIPVTRGCNEFIEWKYLSNAVDMTPGRECGYNKLYKVGQIPSYGERKYSSDKKLKDILLPDTQLGREFAEKYPEWKLHKKYKYPPTNSKAIVDSLKAHTNRRTFMQRPNARVLKECTAFIKGEYKCDPEVLRPNCFTADGFDESMARVQLLQWMEMGGWKQTGGCGVPYDKISPTCKTHGDVVKELGTKRLIELVIERVKRAIRYKGGPEITALMLFETGLCDPIRVFIKNEPHKISKIMAERYRLIASISTVDCLVHRLLYYNQNKVEISKWSSLPASAGLDMATEDGKEYVRKVIGKLRTDLRKHQQELGEMDVSAFDWSLPEWLLHYENDLRLEMMELPDGKWLDYRKVCNVMKYTLTRSLYMDSDGSLYIMPHGVQKSGHTNTSSTNSRISTILCYLSGSKKSRSNGDDALLGIAIDGLEKLQRMGVPVKFYSECDKREAKLFGQTLEESNCTIVEFCSQYIAIPCIIGVKARTFCSTHPEKIVFNFLQRGEGTTPQDAWQAMDAIGNIPWERRLEALNIMTEQVFKNLENNEYADPDELSQDYVKYLYKIDPDEKLKLVENYGSRYYRRNHGPREVLDTQGDIVRENKGYSTVFHPEVKIFEAKRESRLTSKKSKITRTCSSKSSSRTHKTRKVLETQGDTVKRKNSSTLCHPESKPTEAKSKSRPKSKKNIKKRHPKKKKKTGPELWDWLDGQSLREGHRVIFKGWDARSNIVDYRGTVKTLTTEGPVISVPMKNGSELMVASIKLTLPQDKIGGDYQPIEVIRSLNHMAYTGNRKRSPPNIDQLRAQEQQEGQPPR